MKLTRCPYCGKKISYLSAFSIRRRGEYFCNKCKKESNIHIRKTIFIPFVLMLILSLLILGFFLFFTSRENLWFMLLVAAPFFFFYILTPFFVRLKPKKKHMDALYDTEMIEASTIPDPTAGTEKTVPHFVDDIVLEDDTFKPNINADVFNAIKEERNVAAESDGGTKPFDKFEDISSTKPVGSLKDIGSSKKESEETDRSYDLHNFE